MWFTVGSCSSTFSPKTRTDCRTLRRDSGAIRTKICPVWSYHNGLAQRVWRFLDWSHLEEKPRVFVRLWKNHVTVTTWLLRSRTKTGGFSFIVRPNQYGRITLGKFWVEQLRNVFVICLFTSYFLKECWQTFTTKWITFEFGDLSTRLEKLDKM